MNISTLGLIKKAGKLVCGFDAVKESLVSHKAAAVLLASDLSARSEKETTFVRDKFSRETEIIKLSENMEEISKVLGRKTGIIAVTDENFLKAVKT